MERYTNSEYADMLIIYGECSKNARMAAREYALRFPARRHPSHKLFPVVERRGQITGFLGPARNRERPLGEVHVEDVMEHFQNNPRTSIRRASLELGINRSAIHRVLTKNHFHPYHDTPVQDLLPQDFGTRIEFCDWFLRNNHTRSILWTDEATFTRNGAVNFHNTHTWSVENPHARRPHNFQHQFSVNVWAGIVDGRIIGPYFLPPRLDGARFLEFLNEGLFDLIEDLPINVRQNLWFQMDGSPAHYSRIVRNWMDHNYRGKWIGRGGTVPWPARSPDLTPLDFYLWGTVKSQVYQTAVNTRQELVERITAVFENVRGRVEEVRSATRSVRKRCQICLEVNGGHFEHLIKNL